MPSVHPANPSPAESSVAFNLARLQVHVLRWPVDTPVQTSFGTMLDRPAVLVRAESRDGAVGWGESWCNFPGCGAEHRARLIDSVIAPLLLQRDFDSPDAAFDQLSAATAVLAIQSGEPGPIAQAIAGVDIALWDLVARRAGQPLWRMLGGHTSLVPVYASGINPQQPAGMVLQLRAAGHRRFKLKIGFGVERDLANLTAVRAAAGDAAPVMADANQAWTLEQALATVPRLQPHRLVWLEEPLRADAGAAAWRELARVTPIALAAGENLIGQVAFEDALAAGALSVVQPDIAKWGGISGGRRVVERIVAAGRWFCPHFLGAGIGQTASAHLLAAYPGVGEHTGWLEIDGNPNPLRTVLAPALDTLHEGHIELGELPGLGVQPSIPELQALCAAAGRG